MKDQALQIVSSQEQEINKLNHLREYLQHVILREMFEQDWLQELIYHGGTALSMIYNSPRFSEDLDFHLLLPQGDYQIKDKMYKLSKALERNGYQVELKAGLAGNVKSVLIKFKELLYEAGISSHKEQKLNIKLEIDVLPPVGFNTETRTIDKYFPFIVQHHDLFSFFAGKLHAILQRSWTKGRDFFDLNFFLNRWEKIVPNLKYLNNALRQTGYDGDEVTDKNWRKLMFCRLKEVDWETIKQDVEAFVLRLGDLKAFRKDLLIRKLSQ